MRTPVHQPRFLTVLLLVAALIFSWFSLATHAYEHELAAFDPECELCAFGLKPADHLIPQPEIVIALPLSKTVKIVLARQLRAAGRWCLHRSRAPPVTKRL